MKPILALLLSFPLYADVFFGAKENTAFPLGRFSDVAVVGQSGCGLIQYSYKSLVGFNEICGGAIFGKFGRNAALAEDNLLLGYKRKVESFNMYLLAGPSFNWTGVPSLKFAPGVKGSAMIGYSFGPHEVFVSISTTSYFEKVTFSMAEFGLGYMWKFR